MAKQMGRYATGSVTLAGLDHVINSIKSACGANMGSVEVVVSTDLTDPPYPLFLEYGTSRMQAYPIARPAFTENIETALGMTVEQLSLMVVHAATTGGVVGPEHGKAALEAGGYVIQRAWKAKLYDGPPPETKTGTYANSIKVHRVP